ncbi:hypothetical protein KCU61_g39, partial [Aureobasidium melanogenum]
MTRRDAFESALVPDKKKETASTVERCHSLPAVATLISHQGQQRNRFNQSALKALAPAHVGKPGCRENETHSALIRSPLILQLKQERTPRKELGLTAVNIGSSSFIRQPATIRGLVHQVGGLFDLTNSLMTPPLHLLLLSYHSSPFSAPIATLLPTHESRSAGVTQSSQTSVTGKAQRF